MKGDKALKETEKAAEQGIYLYCVAEGEGFLSLGPIGIGGGEVSAFGSGGLLMVLQYCPSDWRSVKEEDVLRSWVVSHQAVIDEASLRFGTLLPFGFGRIITGTEGSAPDENLKDWVEKNRSRLKEKIDKVRGKDEYGIQVFVDTSSVASDLELSPEFAVINEARQRASEGLAFLYQEKLKGLLRAELEKKAGEYFDVFYSKIKDLADCVKVESVKKTASGKQMIMNLSCLVSKDKVHELCEVLEDIEKDIRFSVRFTGPWAPYSFV